MLLRPISSTAGDLAGLRARIPYLADLGVTAVWATPLYAQVPRLHDACGYHGYWADEVDPDDGALEPKLGTWDDVAALVHDLHAAGMRFVLDMVVNHPGRGARIVRQHPELVPRRRHVRVARQPRRLLLPSRLAGLRPGEAGRRGVPDLGVPRAGSRAVKPDGIRMDTAKNVAASYFADSFVPAVRAERPGLFLVGRGTSRRAVVAPLVPVLDAGFDSAFDFPLHRALVDALAKGGSVDLVADAVAHAIGTLGVERATRLVTFLDNHDVPRFLSEAPAGLDGDELWRRYAVALVALFTLPGIPQLYQGDELGMLGAYGANRHDMPAWGWQASTRSGVHPGFAGEAQTIFALVQSLARLRAGDEALWRGSYAEIVRARPGANVLAFIRTGPPGDVDLVVLDGDGSPLHVTMNVPATGWPEGTVLRDVVGLGAPAVVRVEGGAVTLALPPHAAAVYRAGR